jgi:YHS domain-containing protein
MEQMNWKTVAVVALVYSLPVWAGSFENLDKAGVILKGYDAVSYFQSEKPVKGDDKFQVKQDGATYLFSSESNKQAFLKDPKKYEPQFGGWCAYAVADSKSKVDVDPNSFVIQDGRLLLFYKNKDSRTFLREADANWPEVEKKEP